MKKLYFIGAAALMLVAIATTTSCNKKNGHCYCKYVKGDKKDFDLSQYSRSMQQDSCNIFDKNASYFGGSCKLK